MENNKIIPQLPTTLQSKADFKCYDSEFWDEELAELWGCYSDRYKEKNGCRPRSEYNTSKTVLMIWNELHDGSLDEDED